MDEKKKIVEEEKKVRRNKNKIEVIRFRRIEDKLRRRMIIKMKSIGIDKGRLGLRIGIVKNIRRRIGNWIKILMERRRDRWKLGRKKDEIRWKKLSKGKKKKEGESLIGKSKKLIKEIVRKLR